MHEIVLKSEDLDKRIKLYLIRDERVLLDFDLAQLYMVETRRLKEAVNRNIKRFPGDFMFELNSEEFEYIKLKNSHLNWRQYSKYPPYAFTEQGVAMLSSVLRSDKAITINIEIMRAFVNMRRLLDEELDFKDKVNKKFEDHESRIQKLFDVVQRLIVEEAKPKKKVGFVD